MKKTTFFTLFFLLFTTLILSQSNVWKPAAISVDDSQVTFNDAGFFELETGTLRQMIKNAPSGLQKHSNIVLKLPRSEERRVGKERGSRGTTEHTHQHK